MISVALLLFPGLGLALLGCKTVAELRGMVFYSSIYIALQQLRAKRGAFGSISFKKRDKFLRCDEEVERLDQCFPTFFQLRHTFLEPLTRRHTAFMALNL